MGIKDLPEVDRPQKLRARGSQALSDAELLAVLIRTGTKGKSAVELAQARLEEAGPQLARWSGDDLALTRQLVEAGKILGIEVLDHIIVTKAGHTSLREEGYIP
jgi:DNA repair protein RadC